MPFIFGAHLILAALCAIHAVRSRQEMYWLLILFMFPLLGSAVYVAAVLLPDLAGSRSARAAGAAARKALDPGRELREAMRQLDVSRTPGALKRAGDAHMALNRSEEALELYEEAAQGAFAEDAAVLQGKLEAEFACERHDAALATAERLRTAHPNTRLPKAHLIYARTLEAVGRTDEALQEYEAASGYFPGAEARAHWAQALEACGRDEQAQDLWRDIVETARILPRHARRSQSRWIDLARSRLTG